MNSIPVSGICYDGIGIEFRIFFSSAEFTYPLIPKRINSIYSIFRYENNLGFGERLRKNLEQVIAIDISNVEPEKAQEIWSNFDMTCEKCPMQFRTLNEAQMHYPTAHDIARGYLRCCDLRLREEGVVKEHIAYHAHPELY